MILPISLWANSTIQVIPANPKKGEQLTLTYKAGSPHDQVVLYGLNWQAEGNPVFFSHSLKKSSPDTWTVSFKPPANVLAIQFKLVNGNAGNDAGFHDILIHDSDGSVSKGAYQALGHSWVYEKKLPHHITQAEMFRPIDAQKGSELFLNEYERDKKNLAAAYYYIESLKWAFDKAADRRKMIDETLAFASQLLEAHPDEPFVMAGFAVAQQQFGSRHRAAEYSQKLRTEHVGHAAAEEFLAWEAAFPDGGANPEKRIENGIEFLKHYPQTGRNIVIEVILPSFAALGNYSEARQWLDKYPRANAAMYQFLARELAKSGSNENLRISTAQKALSLWKKNLDGAKPSYLSASEWMQEPYAERRRLTNIDLHLDYALALSAAGKHKQAVNAAITAYELDKGERLEVAASYVKLMTAAGRYQDGLNATSSMILNDKWDDELLEEFKNLHVKMNGSDQGFESLVEELKMKAMAKRYTEKMLSLEAPDFTVEVHSGNQLTLSDLKGKVVVLDFWALWCGPCMRAFPFFQQAQEYYRDNPDVVLLAVNTMENIQGEVLKNRVSAFLEDNEYTFEVVYDFNRTAVARMYGVEGIPTRITIGPDGKLQFRDVGFSGEEMFLNMRAQIDLLLNKE